MNRKEHIARLGGGIDALRATIMGGDPEGMLAILENRRREAKAVASVMKGVKKRAAKK